MTRQQYADEIALPIWQQEKAKGAAPAERLRAIDDHADQFEAKLDAVRHVMEAVS